MFRDHTRPDCHSEVDRSNCCFNCRKIDHRLKIAGPRHIVRYVPPGILMRATGPARLGTRLITDRDVVLIADVPVAIECGGSRSPRWR